MHVTLEIKQWSNTKEVYGFSLTATPNIHSKCHTHPLFKRGGNAQQIICVHLCRMSGLCTDFFVWFPTVCTENACLHLTPLLNSLPVWMMLFEDRCRTVQDLHQSRRKLDYFLLSSSTIKIRLLCFKQIGLEMESCTEHPCQQDKWVFRHW